MVEADDSDIIVAEVVVVDIGEDWMLDNDVDTIAGIEEDSVLDDDGDIVAGIEEDCMLDDDGDIIAGIEEDCMLEVPCDRARRSVRNGWVMNSVITEGLAVGERPSSDPLVVGALER